MFSSTAQIKAKVQIYNYTATKFKGAHNARFDFYLIGQGLHDTKSIPLTESRTMQLNFGQDHVLCEIKKLKKAKPKRKKLRAKT